ncbi:MAG: hypothetical protein R3E66_04990 [bacterium]
MTLARTAPSSVPSTPKPPSSSTEFKTPELKPETLRVRTEGYTRSLARGFLNRRLKSPTTAAGLEIYDIDLQNFSVETVLYEHPDGYPHLPDGLSVDDECSAAIDPDNPGNRWVRTDVSHASTAKFDGISGSRAPCETSEISRTLLRAT